MIFVLERKQYYVQVQIAILDIILKDYRYARSMQHGSTQEDILIIYKTLHQLISSESLKGSSVVRNVLL